MDRWSSAQRAFAQKAYYTSPDIYDSDQRAFRLVSLVYTRRFLCHLVLWVCLQSDLGKLSRTREELKLRSRHEINIIPFEMLRNVMQRLTRRNGWINKDVM